MVPADGRRRDVESQALSLPDRWISRAVHSFGDALLDGAQELGGGMARIRRFNPALTGVDYITECLSEPGKGDLYEFDKFGLKSCELTLSKALLRSFHISQQRLPRIRGW